MAPYYAQEDGNFKSDPRDSTIFQLDQPHIRRDFDNSLKKTASDSTLGATEFTNALDYLGIILLELCFGKLLK
ncbi:hypothetical protein MRS44_013188 [Fusarium solani]|uniref:uncharacterized protein n=1 Tax=Fusarium solani TaxID=169388 RepID=UPI0032C3D64A|nr:hypothetical protein MRS44_013188 [Fusarium solani]